MWYPFVYVYACLHECGCSCVCVWVCTCTVMCVHVAARGWYSLSFLITLYLMYLNPELADSTFCFHIFLQGSRLCLSRVGSMGSSPFPPSSFWNARTLVLTLPTELSSQPRVSWLWKSGHLCRDCSLLLCCSINRITTILLTNRPPDQKPGYNNFSSAKDGDA